MIVWVVGDATIKGSETGSSFKQALEFLNAGFKLHDTMIYKKNTHHFQLEETAKGIHKSLNTCLYFRKVSPKKRV